nr:MAG TPA: hypothetical protein [Caudoviricetes sp.]
MFCISMYAPYFLKMLIIYRSFILNKSSSVKDG